MIGERCITTIWWELIINALFFWSIQTFITMETALIDAQCRPHLPRHSCQSHIAAGESHFISCLKLIQQIVSILTISIFKLKYLVTYILLISNYNAKFQIIYSGFRSLWACFSRDFSTPLVSTFSVGLLLWQPSTHMPSIGIRLSRSKHVCTSPIVQLAQGWPANNQQAAATQPSTMGPPGNEPSTLLVQQPWHSSQQVGLTQRAMFSHPPWPCPSNNLLNSVLLPTPTHT
jgi:hypothetical protein